MKQSIRDLLKKYAEIVESPRNQANRKLWEDPEGWNRDMWRGTPRRAGVVPYTVAPDNSLWSEFLDADLRKYYSDPEYYLETQLKIRINHFEQFADNTVFTRELYIWFGVITELSFFGALIEFSTKKEGWVTGAAIESEEDLKRTAEPDFYAGGLMPLIHRYFEVLNEYAEGEFKVMFPEWVRGPFCIATHLRGMNNILMDVVLDNGFFHRLMRFIADSSKKWTDERAKFTGEVKRGIKLYNDEIDAPTISPEIYKNDIFPYEKELADLYGGVDYWHSCGNTTLFLEDLNRLQDLRLYHCGPWTSYERASAVLSPDTALDICLNPQKDVLETDAEGMRAKLLHIAESCKGRAYSVRADGFMPFGDTAGEVRKIRQWADIAKSVLSPGEARR